MGALLGGSPADAVQPCGAGGFLRDRVAAGGRRTAHHRCPLANRPDEPGLGRRSGIAPSCSTSSNICRTTCRPCARPRRRSSPAACCSSPRPRSSSSGATTMTSPITCGARLGVRPRAAGRPLLHVPAQSALLAGPAAPGVRDMSAEQQRQLLQDSHKVPSAPLNVALTAAFGAETPLGHWLRFPWGTSLLGVFRKL